MSPKYSGWWTDCSYTKRTASANPETEHIIQEEGPFTRNPVLDICQELACSLDVTRAINLAPVDDVSNHCLATELSIINGTLLDSTVAAFVDSLHQSLLDGELNPPGF